MLKFLTVRDLKNKMAGKRTFNSNTKNYFSIKQFLGTMWF